MDNERIDEDLARVYADANRSAHNFIFASVPFIQSEAVRSYSGSAGVLAGQGRVNSPPAHPSYISRPE